MTDHKKSPLTGYVKGSLPLTLTLSAVGAVFVGIILLGVGVIAILGLSFGPG